MARWYCALRVRWIRPWRFICLSAFLLASLIGCEPYDKTQEGNARDLRAKVDNAILKIQSLDDGTYREGVAELGSIGAAAVPYAIEALEDNRLGVFAFEFEIEKIADASAIPDLVQLADQAPHVEITPEFIFGNPSMARKALAGRAAIARVLGAARGFAGGIAVTTAPKESDHYRMTFRSSTKPYYEAVEAWYHTWRKTYAAQDYPRVE